MDTAGKDRAEGSGEDRPLVRDCACGTEAHQYGKGRGAPRCRHDSDAFFHRRSPDQGVVNDRRLVATFLCSFELFAHRCEEVTEAAPFDFGTVFVIESSHLPEGRARAIVDEQCVSGHMVGNGDPQGVPPIPDHFVVGASKKIGQYPMSLDGFLGRKGAIILGVEICSHVSFGLGDPVVQSVELYKFTGKFDTDGLSQLENILRRRGRKQDRTAGRSVRGQPSVDLRPVSEGSLSHFEPCLIHGQAGDGGRRLTEACP